ncbi:HAD family hydrolase [Leuconostoc gasicomitatum]|uniref:HAD hydrolase family protein n=1 Tax=Leuconostoc gasicomitatum TaxID=115778 RepID=A0A9Q3XT45_9LACO|nr:HAD hydrolase family protein [Leuconostoc gasicomitatum]MBZ5962549.1 HAD hydrolase family protein [Leuconostoc gasicomitatum]
MKCFIDFDGTLATDEGFINDENIKIIQERANEFVLVTGRNVSQITKIFREYKISIPAIGGNGAFLLKKIR